ncbi:ROK family protein [Geothrix sp. PMB-07]|uniref:ROK family protein n=1 Tax=Geothrix sp. PMB-07 TaxID=3068640 RepID=UPI0027420DB9|nr:ROK family protein [Geothrix sp. PMB-07]WLT30437.1 ROK family protein [Geothrix sp. PMB-07]
MNVFNDRRTVLTLDAGGTNFAFGAMRGGEEVVEPLVMPSHGHDLERCLATLREGFREIQSRLAEAPCAISFAFPGPADYPAGIIGNLANLPAFRGGVALGPMLEEHFRLPTFINNDGDLFAYGEAIAGLLPEVNRTLEEAGSPKRFRNLFGATFGTGFGGGLVHNGQLFLGDNAAAGEIWTLRNKLDPTYTAEEGVSIRAVRRVYASRVGLPLDLAPEPLEIFEIAQGQKPGDLAAARAAFRRMGEVAGDALASVTTLFDGLVVIGGGLAGAAPLFLPWLVGELNSCLESPTGSRFPRLEVKAFNLEDAQERTEFLQAEVHQIPVPGTSRLVPYDPFKRIGVGLSRLGTTRATAIGAYAFALAQLDKH